MNPATKDKLPIPNCWHQSWHRHSEATGLDEFPTRKTLKKHPEQSRSFCIWLWRHLARNEGSMCDQAIRQECENCQRKGVSKIISMRILTHIVKDEDPTLHFVLDWKFNRMQDAHPNHRFGRAPRTAPNPPSPPGSGPERLPPFAVNMPRPRPQLYTNLVARELRFRPWLQEWLEP